MNLARLTVNARRLDRAVEHGYPVEFRTPAQIEADQEYAAILDRHGSALIDLTESMLYPAMRRLRHLNAGTFMRKTVLGTEDSLSLEVGFGYRWSYTFMAIPFYPERLLAIFEVLLKEHVGVSPAHPDYRYGWHSLGGLADLPEGLKWLHIPEERWHQAGTRPHMVDFDGLPPLEDHLAPVLDGIVGWLNRDAAAFRREHGFPVHPSELAEWRRRELLRRLNYGA